MGKSLKKEEVDTYSASTSGWHDIYTSRVSDMSVCMYHYSAAQSVYRYSICTFSQCFLWTQLEKLLSPRDLRPFTTLKKLTQHDHTHGFGRSA